MVDSMRGRHCSHRLAEAFESADLAAVRSDRLFDDVTCERGAVRYAERKVLPLLPFSAGFRVSPMAIRSALRAARGNSLCGASAIAARSSPQIVWVCIWIAKSLITFGPNPLRFAIFCRRIKVGV
jgi:hypothetical protein